MNHFGQADPPIVPIDFYAPESLITVDQWLDLHRPSIVSPERRLYFAVLEDALRMLSKTKRENHRLDALAWIAGDESALLTFNLVCEVLELDPTWLRENIARVLSEDGLDMKRRSPVHGDGYSKIKAPYQRVSTHQARRDHKISTELYRGGGRRVINGET